MALPRWLRPPDPRVSPLVAAVKSASAAKYVAAYGAKADGVTLDTQAVVDAMAETRHVLFGPGEYRLGALSIQDDTTLEILPGAVLLLEGSVAMNGKQSVLKGWTRGIGSVDSIKKPVLKWVGAPNGKVIQMGNTPVSPVGCAIEGICIDANGVSGVTGLDIGADTGGPAWCSFQDMVFFDCALGINILKGAQTNWFTRCYIRNQGSYNPGTGIRIGYTGNAGAANTTLWFDQLIVEGYAVGVQLGGTDPTAHGAAAAYFSRFVLQQHPDNGIAVNAQSGGPYYFSNGYTEGHAAVGAGTSTCFVVGAAGKTAMVFVRDCYLQSWHTVVQGIGWDALNVVDNFIISSADAKVFVNTGGGLRRRNGKWDNFCDLGAAVTEITGGVTGFNTFVSNRKVDELPMPMPRRDNNSRAVRANVGQVKTLLPGDFVGVLEIVGHPNGSGPVRPMGRFVLGSNGPGSVLEFQAPAASYSATQGSALTRNVFNDGANYVVENNSTQAEFFTFEARWFPVVSE